MDEKIQIQEGHLHESGIRHLGEVQMKFVKEGSYVAFFVENGEVDYEVLPMFRSEEELHNVEFIGYAVVVNPFHSNPPSVHEIVQNTKGSNTEGQFLGA